MTKKTTLWLTAVGLAAHGIVAGPASAQRSPVDEVRTHNEEVQRVLEQAGDSISDEELSELKDVINDLIDFEELSSRALARYWADRTDQEKSEFVEVFRELVRNSSVRKLDSHRADSLVYRQPEISGGEAAVTTVAHKDNKSVEIVYHMLLKEGEWRAFDVVIDGSSTLRTYRDSFYREISATSYTAMYARLREKLEQERAS